MSSNNLKMLGKNSVHANMAPLHAGNLAKCSGFFTWSLQTREKGGNGGFVLLFVRRMDTEFFSHPPFPFPWDWLNPRTKTPFGALGWGALCKGPFALEERWVTAGLDKANLGKENSARPVATGHIET